MRTLKVLLNEKGEVVGTAQPDARGRGTHVPGQIMLMARPGQRVMEVAVDDDMVSLEPSALHEAIRAKYLS